MNASDAEKLHPMALARDAEAPSGLWAMFLRREALLDEDADARRYMRTFLVASLVGAIGLFAITIVGLEYLSVAMAHATSDGTASHAKVDAWIAPFGCMAIAVATSLAIRTTIERARNRRRKKNAIV